MLLRRVFNVAATTDVLPVQKGLAPAFLAVVGSIVLPQRHLPLRGFDLHRLVYTRPFLLHHEAVSAHASGTMEGVYRRTCSQDKLYIYRPRFHM